MVPLIILCSEKQENLPFRTVLRMGGIISVEVPLDARSKGHNYCNRFRVCE